jgi:hypothetical protein
MFWALLALIAFGIVAIFGGFTIVDFINIFVPALDLFGGRRD